jgi:hypothetical protein
LISDSHQHASQFIVSLPQGAGCHQKHGWFKEQRHLPAQRFFCGSGQAQVYPVPFLLDCHPKAVVLGQPRDILLGGGIVYDDGQVI